MISPITNLTSALAHYPIHSATIPQAGPMDTPDLDPDVCGHSTSSSTGVYTFDGLVEAGYLDADGAPTNGSQHVLDQCTQTVSSRQPVST